MLGFKFLALAAIVLAVVAFVMAIRRSGRSGLRQTVYEWQTGLLYRKGKFERIVGAGRHWLLFDTEIFTIPNSEQTLVVNAQEVLAQDRLSLKISGLVVYGVTDQRKYFEAAAENAGQGLHTDLQLALREIAASRPLEKLIDDRKALDAELLSAIKAKAAARHVEIRSAAVRDIMLNAETRRLYAEFERARLEGLAALERARGEQAALRSLANSARLLKGNPELMNLRLLHALAGQPGKEAPTVVLGGASGIVPVSKGGGKSAGR
jgi:regulator of protease activity HflC (stomatin/prohibitin superfamily)